MHRFDPRLKLVLTIAYIVLPDLLDVEYASYELLVVMDARLKPELFHEMLRHYRMMRQEEGGCLEYPSVIPGPGKACQLSFP